MKLLYYLAAIGNDNYKKKQDIFFENIKLLSKNKNIEIDVIINMYHFDQDFINSIQNNYIINKYYIHNKKGILVELWKSNPYNKLCKNYDHVLFILDDVLLKDININEMIKIKNKYFLDIISPRVVNATHKNLMDNFNKNEIIRITNSIEIYCILMTPKTFLKYIDTHCINNKWIWGHDLLLKYFGFKTGIYGKNYCEHYFPQKNSKYFNDAKNQMDNFIKKHGFTSFSEIRFKYPPIITRIYQNDIPNYNKYYILLFFIFVFILFYNYKKIKNFINF